MYNIFLACAINPNRLFNLMSNDINECDYVIEWLRATTT